MGKNKTFKPFKHGTVYKDVDSHGLIKGQIYLIVGQLNEEYYTLAEPEKTAPSPFWKASTKYDDCPLELMETHKFRHVPKHFLTLIQKEKLYGIY